MTDVRFPIGVPDLDRLLGGGVTAGESILTLGEPGAGHRTFLYTAAMVHGAWQSEAEIFDLEYGDLAADLTKPDTVHYVSLTMSHDRFRHELRHTLGDEWVEAGLDGIEFTSFADGYTSLAPLNGHDTDNYRAFFDRINDFFEREVGRDVVFFDSFSNLVPIVHKFASWEDMWLVLDLRRILNHREGTVTITHADVGALTERGFGFTTSTVDAILRFSWESAGTQRYRVLTVEKFRELMSRAGDDIWRKFDISIDPSGVGIHSIKKIPAR